MATAAFYHGVTGAFQKDYSSRVMNLSYTIGFNGVASGKVTLESNSDLNRFFEGKGENSHFIKFGYEKVYGGVVESVKYIHGIWEVDFVGALSWWGKMDTIPSEFAWGGRVPTSSNTGIKIFYADGPVGILYEVFRNQAELMGERGWSQSVIDFSSIASSIEELEGSGWKRSYRLNAFETPTFASVVEGVLEELGEHYFSVGVSGTIRTNFKFVIGVEEEVDYHFLEEDFDDVFDINFDFSGVERNAFSVATGTNLYGRDEISVRENDEFPSLAYSALVSSSSSEASDAIGQIAYSSLARENANEGTFSLSTFEENMSVNDGLEVEAGGNSYWGSISEIDVDGNIVTYRVSMTSWGGSIGLSRAPSVERNLIFNPLNKSASLSAKNARRKKNSTGWRV